MAKTENLLHRIDQLERETGVRRTIFAACPNSPSVIRASLRAAKRNNAPIYFAATLNQVDCDGGYTGMTQEQFTRLVRFETERVHFTGPVIIAIDHGGPWLKDRQRTEKWSVQDAMGFSCLVDKNSAPLSSSKEEKYTVFLKQLICTWLYSNQFIPRITSIPVNGKHTRSTSKSLPYMDIGQL